MFTDREQPRLSALHSWVLDNGVTEIVMTELAFLGAASISSQRRERCCLEDRTGGSRIVILPSERFPLR
jgi:hypothetical protein